MSEECTYTVTLDSVTIRYADTDSTEDVYNQVVKALEEIKNPEFLAGVIPGFGKDDFLASNTQVAAAPGSMTGQKRDQKDKENRDLQAASDTGKSLEDRISEFRKENPAGNIYDFLYSIYKSRTGGRYDVAVANETLKDLGISKNELEEIFAKSIETDIIDRVQEAVKQVPAIQEIINLYNMVKEKIKQALEGQDDKYTILKNDARLPVTPETQYSIKSEYGRRTHPISGRLKMHYGIDIAVPAGTSVVAVADGVVLRAEESESLGNVVVLQHENSIITQYAHNEKVNVKAGDKVAAGQIIALSGSSGRSTGLIYILK